MPTMCSTSVRASVRPCRAVAARAQKKSAGMVATGIAAAVLLNVSPALAGLNDGFQDPPPDPFQKDPIESAEKVVEKVDQGVVDAARNTDEGPTDKVPAPNLDGEGGRMAGEGGVVGMGL